MKRKKNSRNVAIFFLLIAGVGTAATASSSQENCGVALAATAPQSLQAAQRLDSRDFDKHCDRFALDWAGHAVEAVQTSFFQRGLDEPVLTHIELRRHPSNRGQLTPWLASVSVWSPERLADPLGLTYAGGERLESWVRMATTSAQTLVDKTEVSTDPDPIDPTAPLTFCAGQGYDKTEVSTDPDPIDPTSPLIYCAGQGYDKTEVSTDPDPIDPNSPLTFCAGQGYDKTEVSTDPDPIDPLVSGACAASDSWRAVYELRHGRVGHGALDHVDAAARTLQLVWPETATAGSSTLRLVEFSRQD